MFISFLLATTLGAAAATATPAPAPVRIPLRDFFRNPERELFALSDDGKWVSYLAPSASRMNVFVRATAGGEPKRVTEETDRDIDAYFWKGSDTLVYVKDLGGDGNFHLVSVGRDGKGLKDLTPFPGVRAEIIDELRDDPSSLLIALNKRKAEVFDAYKVNVGTGQLTLVAQNPGNITDWYADHAGQIRVATATDGVNTSLLYRAGPQAAFKSVLTTTFRDSVTPQFFTFDDKKIYAASNLKRDRSAIVVIDPATGTEEKVLFEHPEVDVDELDSWHRRKVVSCAYFQTTKPGRKCFDDDTNALYNKLEKKLAGSYVAIEATNQAEDMLIVRAESDRSRGTYWLYERATDKLTKLADVSPWLDEKQLAEMRPVTYKTRDGLTLHGYLTLPKGGDGKAHPLVVHPHAEPWSRDEWGFDPEVQFLANRGYAVLQMDFRGSDGYGRRFWESSFKEWGGRMQDDISDGVKYLVGQGVADPKRVCIYGGYAALAGLAFSPELYACGIDYAGVSSLFTYMKSIPAYLKPELQMMYEMVGDPEKDKALLTARSPVFHADKIRAPLFVAQGKNDPQVNMSELNQMVDAIKKRGIDVTYMVKDNEGHGFAKEENRFAFYEAMEQFLAKYIGK